MIRGKNIAIVGLGYVGLPLAVACASAGYRVLGIDIDQKKVEALNQGLSYIEDVSASVIQDLIRGESVSFESSFSGVTKCSIVLICVPTPLKENSKPDLSILEDAISQIAPHLKSGTLVISESTSYPGTLRNVIKPLVDEIINNREIEILYAVAPERVDPGNEHFNHFNTPRVVGALTDQALKLAVEFYKSFTSQVTEVSQPEIAEGAKMLENTFRQVNIALVNEFAKVARQMNFDVRETIDAAMSKPYGFMKFNPGPGVGGHCIPVDPYYLTWSARNAGITAELIEKANEINNNMPKYVVERFKEFYGTSIKSEKILVAGLAYKVGISDIRESPALQILKCLKAEGALPCWFDPKVKKFSEHPKIENNEIISGVIITLPDLDLPIEEWLSRGISIFDCTGRYQKHKEIEQL